LYEKFTPFSPKSYFEHLEFFGLLMGFFHDTTIIKLELCFFLFYQTNIRMGILTEIILDVIQASIKLD